MLLETRQTVSAYLKAEDSKEVRLMTPRAPPVE